MISIKNKYLYIFFFISLFLLIALNVTFYKLLFHFYEIYHDLTIKYYAENFIYFSILSVILIIFFFAFILARSKSLDKNLDKIIELSKNSNVDITVMLDKMGSFGNKINYLTHNIKQISRHKSMKIYSYWYIINFLLENFNINIFLLEADGYIINAGKDIFSNQDIDVKNIVKHNISIFFEEFNYNEVLTRLVTEKKIITLTDMKFNAYSKTCKMNLTFFPVFNINKNLTHVIAVKNAKEDLLEEKIIIPDDTNENKSILGKMLNNLRRFIR